jgi:hypothetical protein
MGNHVVVKIGKMASTNVDSYVVSVQNTVDMDNGSMVVLGDRIPGQPEIYACSAPTDVATQEVLLVESPVLVEVNGFRLDIDDPTLFYNPANRPARARKLKVGDRFTITANGFSAAPTVGQYALPANGSYLLAPAASITDSNGAPLSVVAFKVVAQTTISVAGNKITAYELEVVHAL